MTPPVDLPVMVTKPTASGEPANTMTDARARAVALAEADLRALYALPRFEVVSAGPKKDWLGRERWVVDAEVGSTLARTRSVVDVRRGRVLERCHYAYPVPYDELPMISAEEAVEIARAEASRLEWSFRGTIRAELRRPWFGGNPYWLVATNVDMIGCNARIGVDARTKVVVGRGYLRR